MNLKLYLIAAFSLTATLIAGQPDWNQKAQRLVGNIEQDIAGKKSADRNRDSRQATTSEMLRTLRGAIRQDESVQVEVLLDQLAVTLSSEPLRNQCEQLAQEVRAERAAKEKEADGKIESALQRAGAAVQNARKAPDLDATVQELGQLQHDLERMQFYKETVDALVSLRRGEEFVSLWQDYLAKSDANDEPGVHSILERLSHMHGVGWIPRSQILARMSRPPPPRTPVQSPQDEWDPAARDIVEKIQALEDLPSGLVFLQRLKERRGYVSPPAFLDAAIDFFSPLDKIYRQFLDGTVPDLEPPASSRALMPESALRLRRELFTSVLPRCLGLPAQTKARENETPTTFLDRIGSEAIAKKDYLLAARVKMLQNVLNEGDVNSRSVMDVQTQAREFIKAQDQEAAGQLSLAVASYQRALATGAGLVPAKAIGERLSAIKSAHAKEFDEGMSLFLSPSQMVYHYPASGPVPREVAPVSPPPPSRIVPFPRAQPAPLPQSSASP
jgi:hypothetical protein